MKIKKAEFVISAVTKEQYPKDNLPCIAMVGKSNVGKSSIINALANNSKLARTSSQPGKTRLLNFYKINDSFYIVDLPGYGFARVSQREQEKWGQMIDSFLTSDMDIVSIIHVVDIRHKPTADDIQMAEWINYHQIPVIILANKADKLGKTKWKTQVDQIRECLKLSPDIAILPFSAQKRLGLNSLISYIEGLI